MTNTTTVPQASDIVTLNDQPLRVDWIGTGDYAIHVVTPEGDRFTLDHTELILMAPARGYGTSATWACRTGSDGRRV